LLSIIATQSAQVIENARLLKEEQALIRMQEELRLANDIQTNLLPATTPQIDGYDIAGRSIPAKEVGGDYFDFILLDGNRFAFCLGDVSGKGMPAALLMSNLQAAVRAQTMLKTSAVDCCKGSNTLLFHSTTPEKFVTFFFAILNSETHELHYSNAGHNYPFLFADGENPKELTTTGIVLGALEFSPFEERALKLEPGNLLVLYSDGITEAMDAEDEEFGETRLVELVMKNPDVSAERLTDIIFDAVKSYAGDSPQLDDMTLVIVKRTGV